MIARVQKNLSIKISAACMSDALFYGRNKNSNMGVNINATALARSFICIATGETNIIQQLYTNAQREINIRFMRNLLLLLECGYILLSRQKSIHPKFLH
jgi:hypothetical protein